MKCPKCQAENRDNAQFCRVCGQSLSAEITCTKCGHVNLQDSRFCDKCGQPFTEQSQSPPPSNSPSSDPTSPLPTSFANGRYTVKKFLGEGGKKKVYLAHDTTLDRDVAFALIKTEKLDDAGRTRIKREAQAMGKLGDHPNIVTVFDFGDTEGQPYMVLPLLPGGDVEGLIEKAPDHRLPLDKALEIAVAVCNGLEFAHSKGIVHRDLKPGNVWLTAKGTAQIGDFGLAVAVDLSRLTQDGMMVGTVSYMPPEQAMGGKTTNKADLYSLGAMLYEMVTGRPPFVGDDSVAIIGQHINTPPVSPTWHRADLPPALETLILQLLEKDPEKRPESATIVLKTLEFIGTGKTVKDQPQETPNKPTANPMYRRVFVGREPELKQLQSAFDSAMAGKGGLAVVVGEPGIGKTSLCEQLSTYVTLRGGKPLVGHCYEKGSLSLPYLAFVEALRSYVLSRHPDDLRKEMGTGAGDVARIISEVRERLRIEPRPAGEAEEERYRLLQAVTDFLVNASAVQPLLIILEDLHDADKGTLEMLTHISRHLAGARILIVGTYRDVEVDRTHPLSGFLAELRRISNFTRVALRGLTADEVQRMLQNVVEEDIPWGLAEAVYKQTEGNPLFVQEVLRFLVEEGQIGRQAGQLTAVRQTTITINIPEGLRDVIGKRLSRLSPKCNQLLSIAAVVGRDFSLQVLQKVANVTEEELYSALEEATSAAVLEERSAVGKGSSFRFAHAFFRQTLYEELFAPRRIRTHQQVGRALEEVYAQRLEEHASELAQHFSQSTEPGDLAKAVKYGEIAAKRALSVYAYSEAVRLYEECLKAQEVLDPDEKAKRCDLLLALGEALYLAGEPRRCIDEAATKAFALAEAMSDNRRASLASLLACRGLTSIGAQPALRAPEGILWVDRADRYAPPDSSERVWADNMLANSKAEGQRTEALRLLKHGMDLARRLGDNTAFLRTASQWFYLSSPLDDSEERRRVVEEMMQIPRTGISEMHLAGILWHLAGFYLEVGQRKRMEELSDELHILAERSRQVNVRLLDMRCQTALATLDGRLEEAVDIVHRMLAIGNELNLTQVVRVILVNGPQRALIEFGQAQEGLQIVQDMLRENGGPLTLNVYMALFHAHLGRQTEVAEILRNRGLANPEAGSSRDDIYFRGAINLLEAATLTGHKEAADRLLGHFTTGSLPPFDWIGVTCTFRQLGAAKALLGKNKEARADYQEALRVSTEFRFRPEIALTRLQLAELLLEHYPKEKKEALEHLDFAIKEFQEMKMKPSLERALRHKNILKA